MILIYLKYIIFVIDIYYILYKYIYNKDFKLMI